MMNDVVLVDINPAKVLALWPEGGRFDSVSLAYCAVPRHWLVHAIESRRMVVVAFRLFPGQTF